MKLQPKTLHFISVFVRHLDNSAS